MNRIIPYTMMGLLNERISFCESFIKLTNNIDNNELLETISNFEKALLDFKYCKKLLEQYNKDITNSIFEDKYKIMAIKILSDINYEILKQEYTCISLCGFTLPTNEKCYLPEETKHDLMEEKKALEEIFKEINPSLQHIRNGKIYAK